jgi:hypothetical protein
MRERTWLGGSRRALISVEGLFGLFLEGFFMPLEKL